MKEASKLKAHDWGAATPLAKAAFAYPRSGGMYPTIFRFIPVDRDRTEIPDEAPKCASDVTVSERGNVIAGSGWFELRDGLTVADALCDFADLASRRWAHVELYNCRSFVRELVTILVGDEARVVEAFDSVFRFVVLERELHASWR